MDEGGSWFDYFGFPETLSRLDNAIKDDGMSVEKKVWLAVYKAELLGLQKEALPSANQQTWLSLEEFKKLLICTANCRRLPFTYILGHSGQLEQATVWAAQQGFLEVDKLVDVLRPLAGSNRLCQTVLKSLVRAFSVPEPIELRKVNIASFVRFLQHEQQLDPVTIGELMVGCPLHLETYYSMIRMSLPDLALELWTYYMSEELKSRLIEPLSISGTPNKTLFERPSLEEERRSRSIKDVPASVIPLLQQAFPDADIPTLLWDSLEFVETGDRLQEIFSTLPDLVCVDCEWCSTSSSKSGNLELMQLAFTNSNARPTYLLVDLGQMAPYCKHKTQNLMKRLFDQCLIVGVNFLSSDMMRLRNYFEDPTMRIERYIELTDVINQHVPPTGAGPMGLEKCFSTFMKDDSIHMSKKFAFSNWSYRPIRNREAWYAACDVIIPHAIWTIVGYREPPKKHITTSQKDASGRVPEKGFKPAQKHPRIDLWKMFHSMHKQFLRRPQTNQIPHHTTSQCVKLHTNNANLASMLRIYGHPCALASSFDNTPPHIPQKLEGDNVFILWTPSRYPPVSYYRDFAIGRILELPSNISKMPVDRILQAFGTVVKEFHIPKPEYLSVFGSECASSRSISGPCPLCGEMDMITITGNVAYCENRTCVLWINVHHLMFLRFKLHTQLGELPP